MTSYRYIDENDDAPRAMAEEFDNETISITQSEIERNYENANLFQKYQSVDEDKSINSSVYSLNAQAIHHSKSFGAADQYPDWDNERLTPTKGQSSTIPEENYINCSEIPSYINRSCSDEVVRTAPSSTSIHPGGFETTGARSNPGSRLPSQMPSLQSGASSLEKSSNSINEYSVEIMHFSDEILSRIFSFCHWRDLLCVLSLVCRRWAIIIDNDPYLCRFQDVHINISSASLGKF